MPRLSNTHESEMLGYTNRHTSQKVLVSRFLSRDLFFKFQKFFQKGRCGHRVSSLRTNQQPPQRGGAVSAPIGLGRNNCWPSPWSQLPWELPSHTHFFCPAVPRTTAEGQHTGSFKSVACLFLILPFSFPSSFPHFSPTLDEWQRSSQPWSQLSMFSERWKCDLAE